MVAIITLLVLLFSECGAQIQCSQSELETENQLRELRAMVLELRGKLTGTQKELRDTTTALHDTKTELAGVKARLATTETEVVNLEKEISKKPKVAFSAGLTNSGPVKAGSSELSLVFTKIITNIGQAYSSTTGFFTTPVKGVYYFRFTVLDMLESRRMTILMFKNKEKLMGLAEYDTDGKETYLSGGVTLQLDSQSSDTDNASGPTHLDVSAELRELREQLTATQTKLQDTITRLDAEKPKVAFSAALTNSKYVQAGNTEMNLVFTKIITNVGEAYSSTTGFFTAPVRGVYYVRFTVMDYPFSAWMDIKMFKNQEQIFFLADHEAQGHLYISSGVTLQLEVGDVVNMRLPAGKRLYDDHNNQCTFTGFLLFPL
ncbi:complement C1q tumor necrosis factor-related protein 4-like [Alosa pseudoharengus]|uniref:complement C1q tumor necrosis factor-related protein 4-like n=1 Tax=Alosa pseudoharengus TaxID=34774 RepID=UPI003F8C9CB3